MLSLTSVCGPVVLGPAVWAIFGPVGPCVPWLLLISVIVTVVWLLGRGPARRPLPAHRNLRLVVDTICCAHASTAASTYTHCATTNKVSQGRWWGCLHTPVSSVQTHPGPPLGNQATKCASGRLVLVVAGVDVACRRCSGVVWPAPRGRGCEEASSVLGACCASVAPAGTAVCWSVLITWLVSTCAPTARLVTENTRQTAAAFRSKM